MKKIILSFVVALVAFIYVAFGVGIKDSTQNAQRQEAVMESTEVAGATGVEEKKEPGIPRKISIPRFNVEAEIESVGLDDQRRMDIPESPANTAWYNLGPRPGMNGSAVIAGHKDNEDGTVAVFWDIKNLSRGDKIIVTDSKGEEYTFMVTDKAEYPDSAFPLQKVFNAPLEKSLLNLITCEGEWSTNSRNYSHRVVIYSELDS
jgi:sortase A